jgi:hypothetical protein
LIRAKKIIFWFCGLLLSFVFRTDCAGMSPEESFDLTQVFNTGLSERILNDLKKPGVQVTPVTEKRYFELICGCRPIKIRLPALQLPPPSKNSLPDAPSSIIATAFEECADFRILMLDTSGPITGNHPGISNENVYKNYLIQNRVTTDDVSPMLVVFRWLIENLGVNETATLFDTTTANAEIDEYRKSSHFAPSIVFEFKGKRSLWVELDTEHHCVLIRTEDKWGSYDIDDLSSDAIETYVKNLDAIYATTD